MPTYEEMGFGGGAALTGDRARTVFGQEMGLVAFTLGFAALGAYVGRNMTGGSGFLFFILALGCVFGLNIASSRGHEQLATGLLFGMGLLLGLFISPVIVYYANAQPGVVWQAAACTGIFVGGLGSYGYATRRDLSGWIRPLFWTFLVVFAFGLVALLVSIPHSNVIYCVLMLAVFGGFTVIDFNRLRNAQYASAVPIAAGIFLDIFNVFLLLLSLFGGGGSRR